MIPFENALEIIKENSKTLPTERVDIKKSLNRVLREDIYSDMNMPPFDKSAMDGYACRLKDIHNELEIIETIPAGIVPQKVISRNQCSKIMTGAMIPEGADCVIIVEDIKEISPDRIKYKKEKTGINICTMGEDVQTGQKLLEKGMRITPKEIASLALTGCVNPLVACKPNVGIISTGDEIIEPYEKPVKSQIRNTNSYQLMAHLTDFGCEYDYYGIAKDTDEAIDTLIKKSKSENDLTILTGGVSMGDFDLVPGVLKKNGYTIHFDKVAIQPGKPTVFGQDGDKYVFGLPGNPVSSYLIFEIFVKEFLSGLMGLKKHYTLIECKLGKDFNRKRNIRHRWVPVTINNDNIAVPVEYHGSAHINSLSGANGIMSVPVGISEIKKGKVINVRQF